MSCSHRRSIGSRWLAAIALVFVAFVSGCQSSTDVLDPAAIGGSTAGATAPQKPQALGRGSAKVAMVLPLSAGGKAGEDGRKMRDAAKLAMSDLGNDLITLTIEDSRGDSTRAKDLAVKAMASGAEAVIGPSDLAAAQQLTRLSGGTRPPVLALADNFRGGPGVYAVRLSEADSAAAGAAAVAAKGSRKFVLLVAQGADADAIEKRVANSLSIHGVSLTLTVPFSLAPGGAERAATTLSDLVSAPDAVIVASGSGNPLAVMAALRSRGLLGPDVSLIGTNRWLDRPIDDPLLEGAYVASLDPAETGPIAARFKSTFGYDSDLNVAYAYDMVALVAGITSALGPGGLTDKVLQSPRGFRGSTGIFRFRADGSSERSMPFYRIEKGALRQISPSVSSF